MQACFGRIRDPAKTKATTAITHHKGGRRARNPIHGRSENASAAEKSGCRGGLRSCVVRSGGTWTT